MTDRLRIVLVGDTREPLDEAMKKTAAKVSALLAARHDVLEFNPLQARKAAQWSAVRRFRPDAILYVPGPSLFSFPIARALRRLGGARALLMVATHPKRMGPRWVRRWLRPDRVLVHSARTRRLFESAGLETRPLPLGVDTSRFRPADAATRRHLRRKYGLPEADTIALHVGNFRPGRNLMALAGCVRPGWQALAVGSTTIAADASELRGLRAAGVLAWDHYIPAVHEVYQLADVYVFPVVHAHNAIDFPLSVFEARAAGLPVASTRFGALPEFLSNDPGVVWVDDPSGIGEAAKTAAALQEPPNASFTWDRTVREIEGHLRELLERA